MTTEDTTLTAGEVTVRARFGSRVHVEEHGNVVLSFDHHNAEGAARTIYALVVNARGSVLNALPGTSDLFAAVDLLQDALDGDSIDSLDAAAERARDLLRQIADFVREATS